MKILYVEDDLVDVEIAERELSRTIPGLSLTAANTVAEALALLEQRPEFDLVLTDLRLPDGSAMDVLHMVREHDLPYAVVVLTGQGDEEVAVSAIKAGADDYVTKRRGYQLALPQVVDTAIKRFRAESQRRGRMLRVLYAGRQQSDVDHTRRHLERHAPNIQLEAVASADELLVRLPRTAGGTCPCDVLLLDFNLASGGALALLKTVRDERRLDLPVVLVADQGDDESAVQALRLGAADYIVKHSGYLHELPVALENAYTQACLAREQAALRASEERFRRLAENAPDLIFRYTYAPEPRFEYVSPAAWPMTGYTPDEHYADPALGYKLVHPDDRHLLVDAHAGRVDYNLPLTLRWVKKDGTVVWTEQRNTPIFDDAGRLIAIEGIARDVTQNHIAFEELRQRLAETEALHNVSNALRTAQTEEEAVTILMAQTLAALETDAAAIWLFDPGAGKLRAVATRGWCSGFDGMGIAPHEGITGRVFLTAVPHVESELTRSRELAQVLVDSAPPGWGGAWTPVRTSNEVVGILFVSLPLPRTVALQQTKLLVSLGEMAGSIIQRLRLLQQARAQAELTQQIVNTVSEGLALVAYGGQLLLANPAAKQFLAELGHRDPGQPVIDLGGLPLNSILDTDPAWREIAHQGRTYVMSARPVDRSRPDTSWVLVMNDVTAERENQRYQEAQDRLATVGQLAAGIAHDFNNVLGVIAVYADILLMADNLNDKQQHQVATVLEQAHHAANLVRQVLDFSRRSMMERSTIDVYPLLNEQIKLLRHTLAENIELRLQTDYKHLYVDADATRLRQVIMNLAVNARDAMPDGGQLTFALTKVHVGTPDAGAAPPLPDMQPGDWLRMSISDTGSGIPTATLPHIFEPFFTTKGPGKGTGLGLAQVYGIVKQHGGAIDVTSAPSAGTSFAIYLPLISNGPVSTEKSSGRAVRGGNECVLLVEDNADLCTALTQSLSSLGYRVLPARSAAAALQLAEQAGAPIDLVLSDLVMPDANGIELFSALRSVHPDARLLIMTGHPVNGGSAAAMQQVPHWIQKPFAVSTLANKVRKVLDDGLE